MAIYRLLENSPLGPAEIKRMTDAYEMALRVLELGRSDPVTEKIAMRIVAVTQSGERDPSKICFLALKELRMVPLK